MINLKLNDTQFEALRQAVRHTIEDINEFYTSWSIWTGENNFGITNKEFQALIDMYEEFYSEEEREKYDPGDFVSTARVIGNVTEEVGNEVL